MVEQEHEPALETRQVVVNDPALSPGMNARLTEGLREAVGATEVRVPEDRPRLSDGDRDALSALPFATNGWLMTMIGGFAGVVVAGIVATAATNSYWLLGVSLLIDIVGVLVIATVVIRMTSVTDRPDATLYVAMQEEGILNPEHYFTDLVREFAQPSNADDEDRDTAVEDDHATAAGEQSSSNTPTGGPSQAVGPGT
jgi:predicted lipid-binding transport protein (Tim44 family)